MFGTIDQDNMNFWPSITSLKKITSVARLSFMVLIVGSVSLSTPTYAQTDDRWNKLNKRSFAFNDFFDTLIVRPVAITYTTVLPRFARQGIGNFFSNIDDINVFVNDLLQLKLDDALSDSGRLLVNTTIGVGGIFDFASNFGLQKHEEDFGQTLGYWGVKSGPYLMLPVFGASNVRDSFGLVLDTLFNPIQYQDRGSTQIGLFALRETDTRSSLLAVDGLIVGDRYLFIREAYVQRRNYLVLDGEVVDDFGAF
jgi:phospholipid-binding lipoprotein MlaA